MVSGLGFIRLRARGSVETRFGDPDNSQRTQNTLIKELYLEL